MEVDVSYFGMTAEATGKASERFSFEGNTTTDLRKSLIAKYPELKHMSFRFAVNQALAEEDTSLSAADEIALLPPFAGG